MYQNRARMSQFRLTFRPKTTPNRAGFGRNSAQNDPKNGQTSVENTPQIDENEHGFAQQNGQNQ